MNYGGHFGGDYHYNKESSSLLSTTRLRPPLVLVYRIDGQFINGDAPFWALAQIKLAVFPLVVIWMIIPSPPRSRHVGMFTKTGH